MARSMTAYGRSSLFIDDQKFLIEIHSVNRKHLDIRLHLPKEVAFLDTILRKAIKQYIYRGYVTVRLSEETIHSSKIMLPDVSVMQKCLESLNERAESLGYPQKQAVSFEYLMDKVNAFKGEPFSFDEDLFLKEVHNAINACLKMKEDEGSNLVGDLLLRIKKCEGWIDDIHACSKKTPNHLKDRLLHKIQELKCGCDDDESRMLREIVIFSDRVDVSEEIVRLASHIKQFKEVLDADRSEIGRELDFLIQEMSREINTIAAKGNHLSISKHAVALKCELEKIREQVQNIE